jgi:hypothetical protein
MNPLQGVLGESWRLYRAHLAHLVTIALIVYLAITAVDVILTALLGLAGALVASVVNIAAIFLLQAALTKAVEDVRDGRADLSIGDTLRAGGPRLATVAGASILAGIVIAIGFVLLVVPGLIALTFLSMIVPVVVLEGVGVTGAFRRSTDLVRGNGMHVFGVLAVTFILSMVASFVIGLVLVGLPQAARSVISNLLVGGFIAPFVAVALTLTYYRLRAPIGDTWDSPAGYGQPA